MRSGAIPAGRSSGRRTVRLGERNAPRSSSVPQALPHGRRDVHGGRTQRITSSQELRSRSATISHAAALEEAPRHTLQNLPPALDVPKERRGIIPPSSTIPTAPGGFFRTTWVDASDLTDAQREDILADERQVTEIGKGFERERGLYTPSALQFEEVDNAEFITSQSQVFDLVETSFEFQKTVTMKGQVKVRVLFVKKTKSFSSSETMKFSDQSLTASLVRNYASEPIMRIDPIEKPVRLTAAARNLLRMQGPKVFHETYGTHYVAGFTVGGTFSGFLQLRFVDRQKKTTGKGKVAKAMSKFGDELAGAEGFADEIGGVDGFAGEDKIEGGYDAQGWVMSDGRPLSAQVTNMKDLLDASNQLQMNTRANPEEAVLAEYDGLEDYQEARAFFEERNPGAEPFVRIPEEDYFAVSELINAEFLALDFQGRQLDDLPNAIANDDVFLEEEANEEKEEITRLRKAAQQQIQDCFILDEDARDNWVKLAAYINFVQEVANTDNEINSINDVCDDEEAEEGRLLASRIFLNETLQEGYNDLRGKITSRVDVSVDITVEQTGAFGNPPSPPPRKPIVIESEVKLIFEEEEGVDITQPNPQKANFELLSNTEPNDSRSFEFEGIKQEGFDILRPDKALVTIIARQVSVLDLLADPNAELTLLAPTNEAFGRLSTKLQDSDDVDKLTEVLDLHVIRGALKASDLTNGTSLTTLGGEQLSVSVSDDGVITLTAPGAGPVGTILDKDIESCKGVVHVVDTVLGEAVSDTGSQPAPGVIEAPAAEGASGCPSILELVQSSPDFSSLMSVLEAQRELVLLDTNAVILASNRDIGPQSSPDAEAFERSAQDIIDTEANINQQGFKVRVDYRSTPVTMFDE